MTDTNRTTDPVSHTPGPWHLLPKNPLCIESRHGNIGLVNLARASEADARLIAAAPDLLEVLRDVVQYGGGMEYDDWRGLMKRAESAVAKAEGRPPEAMRKASEEVCQHDLLRPSPTVTISVFYGLQLAHCHACGREWSNPIPADGNAEGRS